MTTRIPGFIHVPPLQAFDNHRIKHAIRHTIPRCSADHGTSSSSSHSTTRRSLLLTATATTLTYLLTKLPQPAQAASSQTTSSKKRPKLKFIAEDSGIRYADIQKGDGPPVQDGQFVIIDYIGYLSDGRVFDNTMSSGRKPLSLLVGKRQVIPGLEECLMSMRQGGRRILIVPPKLGYGDRGVCLEDRKDCLIPPNETLEYDITLRRVAVAPI